MDNEEKNSQSNAFSVDEILDGILDDPKAVQKAKEAHDAITKQGQILTQDADRTSYYVNATRKEEQDGEVLRKEATFTLKVTTEKNLPAAPQKKALTGPAEETKTEDTDTEDQEEEVLEENEDAEVEPAAEEETSAEEEQELEALEEKEQDEKEGGIEDDIDEPEEAEPEEQTQENDQEPGYTPEPALVVGVRFRRAGRIYYFQAGDFQVRAGVPVIVEVSRGREFGTCVNNPMKIDLKKFRVRPRRIVRIADQDDIDRHEVNRQKEHEAYKICQQKIRQHGLNMKLIDAEYTFDNNKILFYFTSEERVDFRDLVRDLAGVFHTRIELRQIGVRDETKILGGYGSCGRPLCCHTYLSDFAPVSIKMAKEQNLSLNPAKISGVCGRLMCCLKNEEETYEELNRQLPHIGDEVQASDGLTGDVENINILRQKVRIIVEVNDEKELHEYDAKDLTILRRRKRGQAKPRFTRNDEHVAKRVDHTAEHAASQAPKDHDFAAADFTAQAAPDAQPSPEKTGKPERDPREKRRRRPQRKNGPDSRSQGGSQQGAPAGSGSQNASGQEKTEKQRPQGRRGGNGGNAGGGTNGGAPDASNPNAKKNGGRSGHGRRGHGRRGQGQGAGAAGGENRRPAESGSSDHSES